MNIEKESPWSKDKMERRGVARFLTKYLDSNPDVNVLNVNAPWGAGKTFFIENWHAELKEERATIYFNAWQHDYVGDAFVALTAAIHDSLKEFIPTAEVEEALSVFRGKAVKAILAATPVIAKGVVKKVTGVDVSEVVGEAQGTDDDTLSSAAEKALDELLQSNSKTMQTVDDFKRRLAGLAKDASMAQAVKAETEPRDLYIFIDELDRCRPTFSIELLERIKHFFDVEGCKFVIACDLEQLQHSMGAVYGAGFDGAKYLKRFFDAEYSLDYSNIERWVQAQALEAKFYIDMPVETAALARSQYFPGRHEPIAPSNNAVLSGEFGLDKYHIILLAVAQTFKLKLRELEKCIRHVRAIRAAMESNSFDFFWAMYLVALKDEAPRLYRRVLSSNDVDAWRELERAYPPRELYCGVANENIHDIAKVYVACLTAGQSYVQNRIREERTEGSLKSFALWQFANQKYAVTSRYPYFVDLAHNIE
ncbi:P-loop NTPase fold protein [Ectopseudomonas khazarica]|uniref:KAP family P-loop NTPase fold protein n=1 Tax=Ectopseudomonas khazarica TaxID=2502979 RepID=UPI00384D3B49